MLKTATVLFYHLPGTKFVLAGGSTIGKVSSNNYVYPYVHSTVQEETFIYYPTLSLSDSGRSAGNTVAVNWTYNKAALTIDRPADDDKWKLLGWYDSRLKDAKKVLDADGSVAANGNLTFVGGKVDNGTLTLSDDVTLYARWKHEVNDVYVETESFVNDGTTRYVITGPDFALCRKDDSDVAAYGVPVSLDSYVNDSGKTIHAIPSDSIMTDDLLWTYDDQKRLNSVGNSTRFVATELSSGTRKLKLKESSSKNVVTWDWDADAKALDCTHGKVLFMLPANDNGTYKDRYWIASPDTDARGFTSLSIFKSDTAWELTWERPYSS